MNLLLKHVQDLHHPKQRRQVVATSNPTLEKLIRGFSVKNVLGTLDREITSVVSDSRKATPGSLFVAIQGFHQNGARFIHDALDRGAVAVVAEVSPESLNGLALLKNDFTLLCVEDCRTALAWLSKEFYSNPAKKLGLVGITGTNGKTTLAYILESIFRVCGERTGIIGSINYHFDDKVYPAPMTTPEADDLNRLLDEMVRAGIGRCFLEVSSHSLSLNRVDGLEFTVAAFTNLSRDHLDFHKTMDRYKRAKKKLFLEHAVRKAVVNIDDTAGREIARECTAPVLTTGIDAAADVTAEHIVLSPQGSSFSLKTPFGSRKVNSYLLGKHNVYNLLSAAAVTLAQEISLDNTVLGLEAIRRVRGRFDRVDRGQEFTLVVDYAHTDDALKNVLQAARAFTSGRVIVLFGCGGDRDRGKRKEMGRVALALADYTIITSDNPRSEDPDQIIRDIREGIPAEAREGERYDVRINRRQGIERAIALAGKGDLVLIAGKGHEDYQILKNETIHFDDCETATEILDGRARRG
jgi:UDP-N-acetylmuramoyl-L-alanyl-D-glutamate--2,6-diaminopimelate ligase